MIYYLTVLEACSFLKVTRQAIYAAMKKGRLNVLKSNGRLFFSREDLEKYVKNKYKIRYTKFNDNEISATHLAKLKKIPEQRIYYLIRKGMIPVRRVGGSYAINISNIDLDFKSSFKKKKAKVLE